MTHSTKVISKADFLARAKTAHGDKFDYSESGYKSYQQKIIVRCKEHDKRFDIFPRYHIIKKNGGCCNCKNKYHESGGKNIIKEDGEILKDVPIEAYKDYYYISNLGRCISKQTGKSIGSKNSSGYMTVQLCNNCVHEHYYIHRLVFMAFGGNHPEGNVVDHISGDKLNNKLTNLRSVTQSENIKNAHVTNPNMSKRYQNIIQMVDLDGNLHEFNNTEEAATFIGYTTSSVRKYLKKKQKHSKGYIFKFKDDNVDKINRSKLSQNIDGFVPIGQISNIDFSNYVINEEGEVVNTKNNKNSKMTNIESTGGYIYINLWGTRMNEKGEAIKNDKGKIMTKHKQFKLHRLIAKYFLKDGETHYNSKDLVVNHKNGNRRDNSVGNLEWVTQKQNVIHGCGKRVVHIDKVTGETIKIHNTIQDACDELKITGNSHISAICKNIGNHKTSHGYGWRYANENDDYLNMFMIGECDIEYMATLFDIKP